MFTSAHDVRALFDRFWAVYPRRVGKQAAWKEWLKIKPDKDLVTLMLAAIAWQAKTPQWQRDGGQYIPHARTWLSQARWEDEAPASARRADPMAWWDDCKARHDGTCGGQYKHELKCDAEARRAL